MHRLHQITGNKLDHLKLLGSVARARYSSQVQECDYVIIGAGSAGSVLTNRLSENSNDKIIVVEAGPPDYKLDWRIHMPAALSYNLSNDTYNWYYNTVPQKHCNNRVLYWPRGRVWGGSSSLNAMVYIRGHALDYDRWESEGAAGWSYSNCLPYFRKAQKHEFGADDYRGGDGPLHVSRGFKVKNPLHEALIEAGVQAGYPKTTDCNGYQQEGVGYFEMTTHKGQRWSTSKAYLRPALNRRNVSIESKALTTKIIFEGKKAVGVEFEQKGKTKQIRAAKEVILCGGAINSPQLLMLSGVGANKHLADVGVNTVLDLPGVGENLQDHLEVYVQEYCKQPITLYRAQWKFPHNMIGIGLKWFLFKTGWASTTHMESGGFIRTDAKYEHPDVQWHFLPACYNDHGRVPSKSDSYQLHSGTMREFSTGTIRLADKNPRTHPLLDPNYLSHPQDIIDLRNCVKLTREVFRQPAFQPYSAGELLPGKETVTDSQIDDFIRERSDTAYHPCATCRMGTDDMSVTDNQGRVHGLESLRVVDASIMPSIVSGNLNAPTIMMAEKLADVIRGCPPLPPSNAPVWKPADPTKQRDGKPAV